MIIRERKDSYIMIKQHDHAFLSGEITKHFNPALLNSEDSFEDVIYAAYEHDCSWIGLDDTPIWNDGATTPYTFFRLSTTAKTSFLQNRVR